MLGYVTSLLSCIIVIQVESRYLTFSEKPVCIYSAVCIVMLFDDHCEWMNPFIRPSAVCIDNKLTVVDGEGEFMC